MSGRNSWSGQAGTEGLGQVGQDGQVMQVGMADQLRQEQLVRSGKNSGFRTGRSIRVRPGRNSCIGQVGTVA